MIFISLLLLFPTSIESICYYPSGRASAQDVPCNDNNTESTCCGPGMICLSNRLCMASGDDLQSPDVKSTYVRGTCTDKSWRSGNCPSFCIDPKVDDLDHGMSIEQCEGFNDRFYCINHNESNCRTRKNILVLGVPQNLTTINIPASTLRDVTTSTKSIHTTSGTLLSTISISVSSIMPEESRTTHTQSASGYPESPKTTETSRLSTGQTLGIAIGISVSAGLFLLALALFYCVIRRRSQDSFKRDNHPSRQITQANFRRFERENELQGDINQVREMPGDFRQMSHELEAIVG